MKNFFKETEKLFNVDTCVALCMAFMRDNNCR